MLLLGIMHPSSPARAAADPGEDKRRDPAGTKEANPAEEAEQDPTQQIPPLASDAGDAATAATQETNAQEMLKILCATSATKLDT